MQFTHEVCREADAPWRELWREWNDLDCLPRLLSHVRRAHPAGHEDLARLTVVLEGRHLEFGVERTMCADRTLCWQSQGGLFLYVLSLRLDPLPAGRTALTLCVAYDPPGFLPDIAESLGLSRRFAHALEADLDRYVRALQSSRVSELAV